MRIIDIYGKEITNPDMDAGKLVREKIFVMHHDAVEAIEEQWHHEVVAEYPNGGKDVEKVIDVEAVEAKEAWDEYEDVLRYVPFTEKELAEIEIAKLKSLLSSTDYQAIKYAEGVLSYEEYYEMKMQRQEWRNRINSLEMA